MFPQKRQEQPALYMKNNTQYFIISRSFLLRMKNDWNKRCRENQNTHFLLFYSVIVFRQLYRLWEKVEKYCKARQATDDNVAHAHCMLGT